MYTAIYVSSAVELFSQEELMALLEKSRKNNSLLDITGMLLYKDGNFMQYLEGPNEAVVALLARIKADPVHRGVIVLLQEEHPEREFYQWAMGFKKINPRTSIKAAGYSDFLDLPLINEQFLLNPSKALKLLLNFKNLMR